MSTTTPPTEREAETTSGADGRSTPDAAAGAPGSPRLTARTERSDRWADSTRDAPTRASWTAPLAFDPSCTRRLRNCVDGENAAFPDGR